MITALVSLLLAADSTNSLALVQWQAVGIEQKKVDFFSDYFAEAVGNGGRIKVATPSAIAAVLGIERQKQLLGCSDDSASCLTELAGALGSYGVISGQLAKVGRGYVITIKVVRVADGNTLVSYSGRPDDEDGLLDFLARSAWDLRYKLTGVVESEPLPVLRNRPETPVITGSPDTLATGTAPPTAVRTVKTGVDRRVFAVIPGAIGIGAGIASVILLTQASSVHGALTDGQPDPNLTNQAEVNAFAASGKTAMYAGIGLAVGAGVALVAAIVLLIEGESLTPTTTVSAWANPNGGGLGLVGAW